MIHLPRLRKSRTVNEEEKKKTLFYLCLAAGLLSCAKELTPQEETASAGVPVKFEISVSGTKADGGIARQDRAEGDKIYVFIMSIPDKYLEMSYDGSSWTTSPVGGEITDIELGGLDDNYFLTAVHFPVDVDVAYADSKFSFTSGEKPVYGSYYLYDEKDTFTVEGTTTVKATLSMQIPAGMVQLYFPGGEGRENLDDYTVSSPMIRPVACAAVALDDPGERPAAGRPHRRRDAVRAGHHLRGALRQPGRKARTPLHPGQQ